MGGNIELSGTITTGGGRGCGGCGSDGSTKVQSLGLGCKQSYGGAVVSSDVPFSVNSPNAFVDLPLLEQLSSVEFLYASFGGQVVLRLDAERAELAGSGATYPTGFAGGETLVVAVDDEAAFTTTFTSGDQSAVQVAARINAAAMIAGYDFMPATITTSGQLLLVGEATGGDGLVMVTGGTAKSALGFGVNDEASGAGSDVPVYGLFLAEFDKSNAPKRVQMKGSSSSTTLMAAGPSATG